VGGKNEWKKVENNNDLLFRKGDLTVLYVLDNFPHKTAFGFPLLFVHDTEESCCA
jgi:hypothetical protein